MLEAVNLKMFFMRYKVTMIIKSSIKCLSTPEHILLYLAGHGGIVEWTCCSQPREVHYLDTTE